MQSITRHIISGVLAIIPLVVTVWIVWFVIDQLIWLGRPAVLALASAIRPTSPQLANPPSQQWMVPT
jgi:uncharacterized membrane protein